MAIAGSSPAGCLRAGEWTDTLASRRPAPRVPTPDAVGRKPPAGAYTAHTLPRRMRPFITRSEIITGVVFAIAVVWLTLVALGMGV
jgi:hypothetical protein